MKTLFRWLVFGSVVITLLLGTGCQTHLSSPPSPIFQAVPVYPLEMRRAGISGEVVVGFIVGTEGIPLEAFAFSSTNIAFEAPAIEAVMKWRFKPAMKDGRPVNTKMSAPIYFRLDD